MPHFFTYRQFDNKNKQEINIILLIYNLMKNIFVKVIHLMLIFFVSGLYIFHFILFSRLG